MSLCQNYIIKRKEVSPGRPAWIVIVDGQIVGSLFKTRMAAVEYAELMWA